MSSSSATDRKLTLVPVKTKKGARKLSLPAFIVASLRVHRDKQERQLGALPGPSAFVFTTSLGKPLEARNVVRSFKAILVKADLPDKRFHDLRHSAGTFLIAQHVHPRVAMAILGHGSITTTMNVYGHVLDATMKEAATSMDNLLANG